MVPWWSAWKWLLPKTFMVVIGIEHIEKFLEKHPECGTELTELVRDIESATLTDPNDLKQRYPSSKVINGKFVVFKVRGNRYRMTVVVAYKTQIVSIRALETHVEYDERRFR